MDEPVTATYGEPVFPGAKADLVLDGFVRYVVAAKFDEVAAFYEKAVAGQKHIYSVREEGADGPRLVLGAGVKQPNTAWAAIVVMLAPAKGKKPSKHVHVLVTKKA
jgi:hypothetical protein